MKLTNHQVAALADHLREQYAFCGGVRLGHPFGYDTLTEYGVLDVDVLNDDEVVTSFEVSELGQVSYYA